MHEIEEARAYKSEKRAESIREEDCEQERGISGGLFISYKEEKNLKEEENKKRRGKEI